jgi:hypothetical protein
MPGSRSDQPEQCPICGDYLTLSRDHAGSRCLFPGHWQTAGQVDSTDFQKMARIMAAAQEERSLRPVDLTGNGRQTTSFNPKFVLANPKLFSNPKPARIRTGDVTDGRLFARRWPRAGLSFTLARMTPIIPMSTSR